MQKIYELSPTEGHEWVIPDDPAGYEHVKTFIAGGRYDKKWGTMEARLEKSHGKKRPKETEIPWLGSHVLFLKQKGLDSLKDILDTNGELVPFFQCDGSQLYAFRSRTIDALKMASSELWFMPGTSRVIAIRKPDFETESIKGIDIFRAQLPDAPCTSPIYVGEKFMERFNQEKLRGLNFRKVSG